MDKVEIVFNKFAKIHTEQAGGTIGGGVLGGVVAARLANNAPSKLRKARLKSPMYGWDFGSSKAGIGVQKGKVVVKPSTRRALVGISKKIGFKPTVIGAGIAAGAGAGYLLGKGIDSLFTKKAGLSSMLAKGISKLVPAAKSYGANIAKDWKVLGRGMKNIGTANKTGIMTATEAAGVRQLGEKQLAQGIKGLGKRVVLPGAAAMYLAN